MSTSFYKPEPYILPLHARNSMSNSPERSHPATHYGGM